MLKRVAAAVPLLALGFLLGAYFGYRFLGRPYLWLGAVGESHMASEYAYLQYREAAYPEAAKAMTAYIAYLERAKPTACGNPWVPGQNPWLDAAGIRLDTMLAWSRLAILHERNIANTLSDSAWAHAEALAVQLAWKEPTRRHLREFVLRLDESWGKPATGS